jgi:hypothetical protein
MQAIEAPDGQLIPGIGELAVWSEAHWQAAGEWFARALPDQIERLWGKIRRAQQLRNLGAQQASDKHVLTDAALALLSPADFGAATAELRSEWPVIGFGPLAASDRAYYDLKVWNAGRRYICANIILPPWIKSHKSPLRLAPGESTAVDFQADMNTVPAFGKLRDGILFRQGARTLLTVEARAQVSQLQMFWGSYWVLAIVLIPGLVVLVLLFQSFFAW